MVALSLPVFQGEESPGNNERCASEKKMFVRAW